jgi:hypothetical protein
MFFCAFAHQPGHFTHKPLQAGRGPHTEHGRYKVWLHYQATVWPFLQNAANGQGRISTAVFPLQHQPRGHPGNINVMCITINGVQIAHLGHLRPEAPGHRSLRPLDFSQSVAAQRQCQIHHLIGHRGVSDFQGLWHHIILRKVETRAIREQTCRPNQPYAAEAQVFRVQLEFTETVQEVGNGKRPLIDLMFQIPLLLLEVLGFDE